MADSTAPPESSPPILLRPRLPMWIGGLIWLGLAILFAVPNVVDYLYRGVEESWVAIFWASGASWLLSGLLAVPALRSYQRLAPATGSTGRRIVAFLLVWLVFHGLIQVIYVAVERWLVNPYLGTPVGPFTERVTGFLIRRPSLSFVMLLGIIGYDAMRSAVLARFAEQRHAADLRADLMKARLDALRGQLQPHFLFNTLNAVAVHLRTDPQAAELMVERLGELLRASLSGASTRSIPLSREFELAEAYLGIQSIRFSDRLTFETRLAPEVSAVRVPPLLLQPLLENAVRHGIEPRRVAGKVLLEAVASGGMVVITVRDDGVGMPPDGGRPEGIGLANCRERVATFGGPGASLAIGPLPGGGTTVRVTLPIESFSGVPA